MEESSRLITNRVVQGQRSEEFSVSHLLGKQQRCVALTRREPNAAVWVEITAKEREKSGFIRQNSSAESIRGNFSTDSVWKQKLKLLKTQRELNWREDFRKDSTSSYERNPNWSWCKKKRKKRSKEGRKDNILTCSGRFTAEPVSVATESVLDSKPFPQRCCLAQSKLAAQFYHLNISERTSRPIRSLLSQTLNPTVVFITERADYLPPLRIDPTP